MRVMARTNHFSHDKQRNRYVANWRYPPDVVPLTGGWFRYRAPMDSSPAQAVKLEAEKLVEYNTIVDMARSQLGTPEGDRAALENIGTWLTEIRQKKFPVIQAGLAAMDARNARLDDEEALRRLSARLGLPAPALPQATKVVDSEELLAAWIMQRTNEKDPPKKQAIQAKRSKLARLFAWKAGETLPNRLNDKLVDEWVKRGNLGAFTEEDIRAYLLKLAKVSGRSEEDAYADLNSLFKVARKYSFITKNPMLEIDAPTKIRGRRFPFTDAEARTMLLAVREAIGNGDTLQWAHPLAAFAGAAINSELLEAQASEFYQIAAGPFAGTWVWDCRRRRLKDSRRGEGSGFRPRLAPVHSTLIDRWGFPAYLASRKGRALFDGSVDVGTNKLNGFISDVLTGEGFENHRTFYAWRHWAITKMGDDALARYVSGHTGSGDLHQKYMHCDPVDLPQEYAAVVKAVEDRLSDPTA